MLDALLLSAALALGQADSDTAEVLRAETPLAAAPAMLPPPVPKAVVPAAAKAVPLVKPVAEPEPAPAPAKPEEPTTITAPLLPPPAAPAAPAAPAPGPPPDRFALMKLLQGTWEGAVLDGTRTYVQGWSEFSYTFSSASDTNLPESFNYRANEPMMQQTWVRIARDPALTKPSFGFRSDWIIGTDYRFTLPQRGIFHEQFTERANGEPNNYGVDPVQFYAEGWLPALFPGVDRGLDVKIGRFYTPYGVESLEAPANPTVSHSYIFSNGSPFTHTGILATYYLGPVAFQPPGALPSTVWVVQGGLVLGSDLFFDPADEPTGIFSIQWNQPGLVANTPQPQYGHNSVKFTTVFGPAKFDVNRSVQHINVFDVVWTHNFNQVLSYNLETLFGYERHIPDQTLSDGTTARVGTATWYGVAQYLSYIVTKRLSVMGRLEFFEDSQGFRTAGLPPGPTTIDQTKGLYTALTLGATFKPHLLPSGTGVILIQPELRFDHNDESRPFEGHHNLATASTAFIVRW